MSKHFIGTMFIAVLLLLGAGCVVNKELYPLDEENISSCQIVRQDEAGYTVLAEVEDKSAFLRKLKELRKESVSLIYGDPPTQYIGEILIRLEYLNGDYDYVDPRVQYSYHPNERYSYRHSYYSFDYEGFKKLIEEYVKIPADQEKEVLNEWDIIMSPLDKSAEELITNVYTDLQLLEIQKTNLSITELNKQYPIECIRCVPEQYYRITYRSKKSICVLLYDIETGNRIGEGILRTPYALHDAYQSIRLGQSLSDVKRVDPTPYNYSFLLSEEELPLESIHYTMDGYLITIHYVLRNNYYIVQSITEEYL